MAFKLGQKPTNPVVKAQSNNYDLIKGNGNGGGTNWQNSMMNINSPQYKAATSNEPDASSVIGTNSREQLNNKLGLPKNTPPTEGVHYGVTNKDIKVPKYEGPAPMSESELFNQRFNKGYGGITTGAANILKGNEEAETIGSFLPGAGEVIDAKNTIQDLKKGDYAGAAMNAAGFMLPFVPGKAIKKLLGKAEDAFYPTTVYRQAPTNTNIARTSYKGSESAAAKKVKEKGDFFTDSYKGSEFYGRGDFGNRGIRQGDDVTITEAKLPFWMKDTRFDPDVQKLKKSQGGAQASEYIVPNKGFSSMFVKKKSLEVKGLPPHIADNMKGVSPLSDESSFFTHTNAGKYVMDQQKGARSYFGVKEK